MYRIEPMLDGDLVFSKDVIQTPYGEIVSRWIVEKKRFLIFVTVPTGTCCEVKMPDGSEKVLKSGNHRMICQL